MNAQQLYLLWFHEYTQQRILFLWFQKEGGCSSCSFVTDRYCTPSSGVSTFAYCMLQSRYWALTKLVFYACDNTNKHCIGWGYMQEDTSTVCSCYHTHGKLIFNWWLMHPLIYKYSSTTSFRHPGPSFKKNVDNVELVQNMLNHGLGCSSPLTMIETVIEPKIMAARMQTMLKIVKLNYMWWCGETPETSHPLRLCGDYVKSDTKCSHSNTVAGWPPMHFPSWFSYYATSRYNERKSVYS